MVLPDEPGGGPDAALVMGGDADESGIPESRDERVGVHRHRSSGDDADVDGSRGRLAEHDRPDRLRRRGPRLPPDREREAWLWGLALQAVSPFAIRMSRKLWPPSLLTPLLLVLWISHRHRQDRWGAFAWGLVGALIGQVHLSGWFVAAGLVVGTAVAEFRGSLPRSRNWHFWLLGSALGLISAIPWARVLLTPPFAPPTGFFENDLFHRFMGYLYGIVATTSSLLPFVVLGLGRDSVAYDVGPIIYGFPMHVPDLLRLFITLAVVLRIAVRLIDAFIAPCLRWTLRMISRGPAGPGWVCFRIE